MYISLSFPIRLFQYIHSIYRINLSVVTKLPLSLYPLQTYFAYIIHHRLTTFLLTAAYLSTTVMGGIETVVIIRNRRMFVNWLALSLFRRSTICDPINSWNFEIGGAQPPYFCPHIHYTNLNNTSKGYFSNYLR